MKLSFTRRATQDVAAIGDYLRSRSPAGAARVSAAILESLQILTQFQMQGGVKTSKGCASWSRADTPISSIMRSMWLPRRSSSSRSNTRPKSVIIRTFDALAAETMKAVKDIVGFVRR
jgi:hypothetical protein